MMIETRWAVSLVAGVCLAGCQAPRPIVLSPPAAVRASVHRPGARAVKPAAPADTVQTACGRAPGGLSEVEQAALFREFEAEQSSAMARSSSAMRSTADACRRPG